MLLIDLSQIVVGEFAFYLEVGSQSSWQTVRRDLAVHFHRLNWISLLIAVTLVLDLGPALHLITQIS